jgi:hypothetical protein
MMFGWVGKTWPGRWRRVRKSPPSNKLD